MTLKERAKKLKVDIPAIYISMREKETPVLAKVFAAITVVYALSPIDLIPDFIPILGYLDDIIILPALIALTVQMIPTEVMERCRERSKNMWADGKPKKWYYVIPFILIWTLTLFVIIKAISLI